MTDQDNMKPTRKGSEAEPTDPVHVVRKGAIAASIWQRQSPSGYAYFDFSLSRSWKVALQRTDRLLEEFLRNQRSGSP